MASAARRSYGEAFVICFRGGAFSAVLAITLCVGGVTVLYVALYLWYVWRGMLEETDVPVLMVGYGFGASFVALFMQVRVCIVCGVSIEHLGGVGGALDWRRWLRDVIDRLGGFRVLMGFRGPWVDVWIVWVISSDLFSCIWWYGSGAVALHAGRVWVKIVRRCSPSPHGKCARLQRVFWMN